MKNDQKTTIQHTLTETRSPFSIIAIPDNVKLIPRKRLIDELSWFAYTHTQVMSDVLATFQREEIKMKLVYGLDFDIIYSYVNPWSRENAHSRIIEYFIENDSTPFTLLPGSTEELFDYLKYVENQEIKVTSLMKDLKDQNVTDETIQTILSLCSDVGLGETGKSIKTNLNKISKTLVEVSRRYSFSMNRLIKLLHSNRLISLMEIFKNKDEPIYNEYLMNSIFIQLVSFRGGEHKKKANLADAKNIATIIQHSKQESQSLYSNPDNYSGYFLRLLTTTNCIFKLNLDDLYEDIVGKYKVKTLPTIIQYIKHSLAVRSCFEAVYATVISNHFKDDIHKCREVANNFFLRTEQFAVDLNFLDGEEWNYRFSGQKDTIRIEKLMKHLIPTFIIDPCYQTMKYLLVQDIHEHLNKQELYPENDVWWEPNIEQITQIGKRYLREIEKSDLTKTDLYYKKQPPKDLLKKLGISDKIITSKDNTEYKRWIIQNNFTIPKEELFVFDYNNDIFYTSWPCNIKESQALNIINRLFILGSKLIPTEKNSGEVLIVFENGNRIEKLCNLPLKQNLDYNEYKELLLIIEHKCEKKNVLPSQIWCDTIKCNLRFDLYIIDKYISQGILFAFKDIEIIEDLIYLFKETSPWATNWPYSDNFSKFFENGINRRKTEWLK